MTFVEHLFLVWIRQVGHFQMSTDIFKRIFYQFRTMEPYIYNHSVSVYNFYFRFFFLKSLNTGMSKPIFLLRFEYPPHEFYDIQIYFLFLFFFQFQTKRNDVNMKSISLESQIPLRKLGLLMLNLSHNQDVRCSKRCKKCGIQKPYIF